MRNLDSHNSFQLFFFSLSPLPNPILNATLILCKFHFSLCEFLCVAVVKQTTQGNGISHVHADLKKNPEETTTAKMFSSLYEAARSSPFKGPLTVARCDAAAGSAPSASGDSCEFGSTKYFLLCGLGGIISCGKCLHTYKASDRDDIRTRHNTGRANNTFICVLLCDRLSSAKYHCYVIFFFIRKFCFN